jgi:hypothetical protein
LPSRGKTHSALANPDRLPIQPRLIRSILQ